MIAGKFDVVFRGQTVKSFELDLVKDNLVKLFKSSPEAIEKLFSGNEVAIRKGLDYTGAMKYQSALRKAGALALIKEVESETASAVKPPQADVNSQPAADTSSVESVATGDKVTAKQSEPVEADAQNDLTIAKVGAQILPDKIYEKRDVDTSALSLAKAGERILPKREPEEYPQPDIDHLSLGDS